MSNAATGATFGLIGALAALPRRQAARAVAETGGRLQRGTTRQTTHVIFGRKLLDRAEGAAIAAEVAAARAPGRRLMSEAGFLRQLRQSAPPAATGLSREALAAQSGLEGADLDVLALFDAFECDAEPFSFRDLILARKYAGLIRSGATPVAIARSVHRSGAPVSLTAKSLRVGGDRAIYACDGAELSELDGQLLLGLDAGEDPEDVFAAAAAAEAEGDVETATVLYGRCLGLDPGDAIAAFNRANCLRTMGRAAEAEADYVRALQLDPGFVEAWFNLAGLVRDQGRSETARLHLEAAVARDPGYGDAVFNLATLAFVAGDLDAARRHWERYLALDRDSDWARTAERALSYIARNAARSAG